jgi:hypothetical protein
VGLTINQRSRKDLRHRLLQPYRSITVTNQRSVESACVWDINSSHSEITYHLHSTTVFSVPYFSAMRACYSLWSMLLIRRNPFLLRAYAFATTPPNESFRKPSSRLFSSLFERTEAAPSVEKYLSITSSSAVKSFGGLCYSETPEDLQRVVFVLGGPGSGKVWPR